MQTLLAILAMTLFSPYDSPTRDDGSHSVPVRGDAIFSSGRILAVDDEGYAVEAADAAGLIVLGRISKDIDATDLSDGDVVVPFDVGVFAFANSGAGPVLAEHYGRPVFIEDDVTVTADPGDNNVFAGFCRGFLDSRVWVDMRVLPMLAAFFGNNPDANFRYSVNADRQPVLQLWNQTQSAWQTVQLAGASGTERVIIG